MKKINLILIIFVGSLIILSALVFAFLFFQTKAAANSTVNPITSSTIDIYFPAQPNFIINAELAQTPAQWERGLMFRTSMAADHGMLFVFPAEAPQSFWMKNTKIPLDMIFISAAGKIVDIKNDFQPCLAADCPSYTSAAPAQYALEINGGLAQKNSINIGDSLQIKK